MSGNWIYSTAKLLQGIGLVVVLAGVLMSISLGMQEEGLASMAMEFKGLGVGGLMFFVGWLLERKSGGPQ